MEVDVDVELGSCQSPPCETSPACSDKSLVLIHTLQFCAPQECSTPRHVYYRVPILEQSSADSFL